MSTREKLINRFKLQPRDFTFEELTRLLGLFGFQLDNKGATSGSRVSFSNGVELISLHKPHPANIVKQYEMKAIAEYLRERGLI